MRCHLVALSFGLLCVVHSPLDAGVKSDSKVKATVAVSKTVTDGKRTITVSLEIEKGVYLIGNPAIAEFLEGTETSVKVRSKGNPIKADVQYPLGRVVDERLFKMSIYEGRVAIPIKVPAELDVRALTIEIRVRAFGRGLCWQPAIIKLTPGEMP